jgi:hypothetical protein
MKIPNWIKSEFYCVGLPYGFAHFLIWLGVPWPIALILQIDLMAQSIALWKNWYA